MPTDLRDRWARYARHATRLAYATVVVAILQLALVVFALTGVTRIVNLACVCINICTVYLFVRTARAARQLSRDPDCAHEQRHADV